MSEAIKGPGQEYANWKAQDNGESEKTTEIKDERKELVDRYIESHKKLQDWINDKEDNGKLSHAREEMLNRFSLNSLEFVGSGGADLGMPIDKLKENIDTHEKIVDVITAPIPPEKEKLATSQERAHYIKDARETRKSAKLGQIKQGEAMLGNYYLKRMQEVIDNLPSDIETSGNYHEDRRANYVRSLEQTEKEMQEGLNNNYVKPVDRAIRDHEARTEYRTSQDYGTLTRGGSR